MNLDHLYQEDWLDIVPKWYLEFRHLMAIIEFEKIARSHSASNNVYFSVLKYINGTSNSLYLKKKKKKKKKGLEAQRKGSCSNSKSEVPFSAEIKIKNGLKTISSH